MKNLDKTSHESSRRQFVKTAAYVAPAILTLQANAAYAKSGSEDDDPRDSKEKKPK